MFKRRFQRGLWWNQVKYARITITHVCFIAFTLAGSLRRCLNTRPNGDPANVNAWKNMCDPYILSHCVALHSTGWFWSNIWLIFHYDTMLSLFAYCGVDAMQQIIKKIGFHDVLTSTSHFYVFKCFHLVALILSFKWRFRISSHAINSQ